MQPTKKPRKKRLYRMDDRAKAQAATRLRIVEAAVHLHEKLGPAATTVSAIAARAGVQRLTVYRHFPQRSDLIVAVFRQEVDACADAAPVLAAKHSPGEALSLWLYRFLDFITTKRGLAAALHTGDPAYAALPAYFDQRLKPALRGLLDAAVAAGEVRADVEPHALIEYTFGDRVALVEFVAVPEGIMVRVTFDAETDNPAEMQRQGWQAILDNFVRYVEGHR